MLVGAGIIAIAVSGCGSKARSDFQPARPGHVVELTVRTDSVGDAAFVPVQVDGRHFMFRLDTGASRTVIAANVAAELRLPGHGAAVAATTVGCSTEAAPVGISDWSLGGVRLPRMTITSQAHLSAGPEIGGTKVVGLLGSDVLARMGDVALDIPNRRLILNAKPPVGGTRVPMKVGGNRSDGIYEAVPVTIGRARAQWLIDTGSGVSLVSTRAVTGRDVKKLGGKVSIKGAAGCGLEARPILIKRWSMGSVRLPEAVALSVGGLEGGGGKANVKANEIQGVLAAGVLAAFGQVTFEFADSALILPPDGSLSIPGSGSG
jgi:predicted aspartyl protease